MCICAIYVYMHVRDMYPTKGTAGMCREVGAEWERRLHAHVFCACACPIPDVRVVSESSQVEHSDATL